MLFLRSAGRAALAAAAVVTLIPSGASAAPARLNLPSALPTYAGRLPDLGPAAALEPVHVLVGLRLRDEARLHALIARVSNPRSKAYAHYLTPAQFRARFSPSAAEAAAVGDFARSFGFSVAVPRNRLFVELTGTVGQAEAAFATTLDRYRLDGQLIHAPASVPSVPGSLAGIVTGVEGLNTGAVMRPAASSAPAAFANAGPCSSYWGATRATDKPRFNGKVVPYAPCGYTPTQLEGAYGMKAAIAHGVDGKGVTVGIIDAWAYQNAESDADTWSQRHGLPPVDYTDVSDPVAQNVPEAPLGAAGYVDPDGWSGEQMLDIEAVHSMAPGAKIVFDGADSPLNAAFTQAQNDMVDNKRAQIVSNSYGGAQDDADSNTDAVLQQAAATGIGFYFSSGDEGDETQDPNGPGDRETDTSANNPLATAVGGTSLAVGKGESHLFETAWGTSSAPLSGGNWGSPTWIYGGGGGTSQTYAEPAYQKGIVPDSIASYWAGKPAEASQGSGFTPVVPGRAEPDVAMDGDPNTGLLIGETQDYTLYGTGTPVGSTPPPVDLPAPVDDVHYGEYRLGGTSLSSPLFAGVMALADQLAGKAHGFVNPALYQASSKLAFRDVSAPAQQVAVVRNDYVNGVNDADGVSTSLRIMDQVLTLHDIAGYDDVTGLGSPRGLPFLRAMAPGKKIPGIG